MVAMVSDVRPAVMVVVFCVPWCGEEDSWCVVGVARGVLHTSEGILRAS